MTLIVDDSESVTRQYIGDLEQEVRSLEEELAAGDQSHSIPTVTASAEHAEHIGSHEGREPSPNFIEGGGLSFIRHLFADTGWREHDSSLLRNLSKGSGPAEAGVKSAPLPSVEQGRVVFDK
ncbi:hypothetical protein N7478_006303 [Penicillium angulare]|uniref:uncharacterized protein n=1 Tax=Penicillium angulare TaxID=116970 RepID=UPI002541F965|nr:uncharacterized protein N7478_006303 [Penicillium angulare]KAJ5280931.1 hypothetical protein N7478_006303 [Penicillium angulare]